MEYHTIDIDWISEHVIKLEYMPESVAYCITLIFHNCGKKQISLESSSTINFNMASETDKYSNWNSSSTTFYILPVKLPTEVMNKKTKNIGKVTQNHLKMNTSITNQKRILPYNTSKSYKTVEISTIIETFGISSSQVHIFNEIELFTTQTRERRFKFPKYIIKR